MPGIKAGKQIHRADLGQFAVKIVLALLFLIQKCGGDTALTVDAPVLEAQVEVIAGGVFKVILQMRRLSESWLAST